MNYISGNKKLIITMILINRNKEFNVLKNLSEYFRKYLKCSKILN